VAKSDYFQITARQQADPAPASAEGCPQYLQKGQSEAPWFIRHHVTDYLPYFFTLTKQYQH
jgi:hypothetical protein